MTDLFDTPQTILSQYADTDAVDSFIAYRKNHKRAALTDRGAKMLAKTLAEIVAKGGDATEALDMAQEHGWQTIKANWYFRSKGAEVQTNTRVDQIAIAARFARTPDEDCF